MNERITVVLADDHAVLREMLALRLEQELDFQVVAEVADAGEALAAAREHDARLLVLDIDMPGLSPFAAARQLGEQSPGTRIVFLSGHLRDRYLDQVLEAGAAGYLLKHEHLDTIVNALRLAGRGRAVFSPAVRERMRPAAAPGGGQAAGRLDQLSPRELEALRYLAGGLSHKEIAQVMAISPKTVEQHCTHLMDKLDIHDRVELARFAIREGLLEP
ncbi:response regulator transcription factor [Thioalkalivibrio sp. XN8]|uniref:response regulator n=1 Tax=Thioalkalivibrio sp. XN8 TaxID=2712863 RepID=UPI0013EBB620|nr:response regulator transcription factor [Thioalkalivibrio sp. XN8]NGP52760.1 response regulator transcription factor [Thioalkalivibrio sp. XN8]